MNQPKWVRRDGVLVVHDRQIQLFGGQYGLRDESLLESAIAQSKNFYAYEDADMIRLAAAYGYGICQNHPFVDGNKRTAFVVMVAFLKINDCRFHAAQVEVVGTMEKLADSKISEAEFTDWVRAKTEVNL